MRLLLIANDFPSPYEPDKGIFNLYLARALAHEHEVRVICPVPWVAKWKHMPPRGQPAPTLVDVVIDGVRVYYPRYFYPPKVGRSRYGWFFWQSIRPTVWRVAGSYLPDAVLGYWAHPDGEAAVRVGRLFGVPAAVIVGGSDVLLLPRGHRRRCVARVLTSADAVIAVSRDLRDHTVRLGVPPERVHVWSQGVDLDVFSPGDRTDARRRLGIPIDGKAVLWVGRMHPVKAVDVLIDAAAKLGGRRPDVRFYLAGNGPLRSALETRAAPLAETVYFVGPQPHDRLGDWYRAADLTVLPSHSEGIPNTLRESLACGTPFVASRVGGIPELANGPGNRLVQPGDSSALSQAIEEALTCQPLSGLPLTPPASWAESAAALIGILDPLVAAAQDSDRPKWAGQLPRVNAVIKPNRFRLRQLLRRGMAVVLPRRLFMVRGPGRDKAVALTFDDGPHPQHTPRLLDTLRRHGARATFFVVGRMADRYPDMVRRIASEGHDLANHSYFHEDISLMSSREVLRGVIRTQELLRRLAGKVLPCYRPPRGKLRFWIMLRLWWVGMRVVLWEVDPRDYSGETPDRISDWFRRHPLRAGDIVLFHDRLPYAAEVLPELIEANRRRGLSFVPLSHWIRSPSDRSDGPVEYDRDR